jgi:hypothetical protein
MKIKLRTWEETLDALHVTTPGSGTPANSTSTSTRGVQSSTSSDETHNPLSQESEITRDEAIQNLLMDEELSDLLLVGTDGVAVRSNRCMLASRSKVFRRMLYGDFSEASSTSISLDYKGEVVQAVVEYIYTDKCEIFNECNVELARTVVCLAEAANFFDLPKLSQKAKDLARSMIREQPSLACVILGEYSGVGGVISEIEEYARQAIRSNPSALLDQSTAIWSMSPALLETIIQDKHISANEYTLFRILEAWTNATDDHMSNSKSGEPLDAAESQRIARREAAKQMTRHLRLERIDPHHLCTTVTSSGLVTQDQLLEAYKSQALNSRKHGISFEVQRTEHPVWKKSNDDIATGCDRLKCLPMTSGIHKWTLKVENQSSSTWLGVVPTGTGWPSSLLDVGWFYANKGCVIHSGKERKQLLPTFEEGSEVTLILDLRSDLGGTLRASVDGSDSFILFSGMLSHPHDHDEGRGFRPAFFSDADGKVRLLGMEEQECAKLGECTIGSCAL